MRTGKLFTFNLERLWNEENKDYEIKRAQIYMLQGFVLSFYALGIKTILTVIYNQMITRNRYKTSSDIWSSIIARNAQDAAYSITASR